MALTLGKLPVMQSWSCHQTGECCREHIVEISQDEKLRIERQGWERRPEYRSTRLVVPMGLGPDGPRYRLAQRADGSCVFLDEGGLCRIHADFGEAAKPLACRVFPYVFVYAGDEWRVGLRFSCPSAVWNLGPRLSERARGLESLLAEVVRAETFRRKPGPPCLFGSCRFPSWAHARLYFDTAARFFRSPGPDIRVQCLRLAAWQARLLMAFREEPAAAFSSLLDGLAVQTLESVDAASLEQRRPSRWARAVIRAIAFRLMRRDRAPEARRLWGYVTRLRLGLGILLGPVHLPRVSDRFPCIWRESLRRVRPELSAEASEILYRYLFVKLSSGQFCGPAFFRLSALEGLAILLLCVVITFWLARWRAAAVGRDQMGGEEVALSLSAVDHHVGYDPFLAGWSVRQAAWYLWRSGQLIRLLAHAGLA
jgi:lysine-N-methylase